MQKGSVSVSASLKGITMKTLAAILIAASFLATAGAASARPHHRHEVCTTHHHHRVCTWR